MRHVPRLLVMFGCWENVSTQAGEMAHKAHIKEAMFSTNRKDWETQIMSVHARKLALVHHKQQLLGKNQIYLLSMWILQSNFVCKTDEIQEDQEVMDTYQGWLDLDNNRQSRRLVASSRLGSSMGIKFELEKSWESKL